MPIDKLLFRQALGSLAAGVTIVTTVGTDRRPCGLTVTAFTSVSISPPLVLVCVDKQAESYPHLQASDTFAVNFLSREQRVLSERFATSGGDKFSDVCWHAGLLGAPILEDTIGHVECRTVQRYDGGDHTIFLGQVESAAAGEGEPLLYYRGAYRQIACTDPAELSRAAKADQN